MSLMEDRLRRITRLFIISVHLQSGQHASRTDLAALCNCSCKTISRDLEYLQEAGIPLYYDSARHSYALLEGAQVLSVPFTISEMIALALAKDAMLAEVGAAYETPLRSAFDRVVGLMPPRLREEMDATAGAIAFHGSAHRDYSAAPWSELLDAIRTRSVLEIEYHALSTDTLTTRSIDPYSLGFRDGFWIMIAYCHLRHEVRTFSLDCIRSVRRTGEHYTVQPGFSVSEYLKNSVRVMSGEPVQVALRFEPEVARWARRRRWSFPHTMEDEDDGALVLRGTVAGLHEISREALRWGAGVTALEPPELRRRLLDDARKIVDKYKEA